MHLQKRWHGQEVLATCETAYTSGINSGRLGVNPAADMVADALASEAKVLPSFAEVEYSAKKTGGLAFGP